MYCTRYFRLRRAGGFTDDLIALIQAGYDEWRRAVEDRIAHWPVQGVDGTPTPEYEFGPLTVSADRRMICISIGGDPHSYGALKLFEDGVPAELLSRISAEDLRQMEASYENQAMRVSGDDWMPVGNRA